MTPAEAGTAVAATWPPLTEQQVADAARILAAVTRERAQEAA
jgi:hypothetical protein